jgi:hypothetical protein
MRLKSPKEAERYFDMTHEERQAHKTQCGAVRVKSKENPTHDEAKDMWWWRWGVIKARDSEAESKFQGVAPLVTGKYPWLAEAEPKYFTTSISKTYIAPNWLLDGLKRYIPKMKRVLYYASTGAKGNNQDKKTRRFRLLFLHCIDHWRRLNSKHSLCKNGSPCKTGIKMEHSVRRLENDEYNAFWHILRLQRFSHENFYSHLADRPSTSLCENSFSTWAKHGRDKAFKNEDYYVCTTMLANILEINDRVNNFEWKQTKKHSQPYRPTWRNALLDDILSNLEEGDKFSLQEFAERVNGVVCRRQLMECFGIIPSPVDIEQDAIFCPSSQQLVLELQKYGPTHHYCDEGEQGSGVGREDGKNETGTGASRSRKRKTR